MERVSERASCCLCERRAGEIAQYLETFERLCSMAMYAPRRGP
ncbi:hypothetical protein ABTY98_13560 [Streptomyces sp. NPDC096040]